MTEVKIAELKANLSAHLAEVRKGATVVVCDRSTPIARIVPFNEADDLTILEAVDPPREAWKIKPVKLQKHVNLDRVLAESREDTRF